MNKILQAKIIYKTYVVRFVTHASVMEKPYGGSSVPDPVFGDVQ
ncbi:MAG: hypothetical protein U7123_05340 [Potamolinea sp.]